MHAYGMRLYKGGTEGVPQARSGFISVRTRMPGRSVILHP